MNLFHRLRYKLIKAVGLQSPAKRSEAKRVKLLRDAGMSDTARWNKLEMLQDAWNERTVLLGDAIPAGAKVIEFGAANYFLKNYLGTKVTYVGADIISRHEDMLVCDLNVKPLQINLEPYDTVVLSGVLEYIYDIENFIQTCSDHHITNLLFSYACANHCKQNRLHNGWLSDFTKEQIETYLEKSSYLIKDVKLWNDQHIFITTLNASNARN